MKPKYTITVTCGTDLYRTYNPTYRFWTIATLPDLLSARSPSGRILQPSGRILQVCGKTLDEYRRETGFVDFHTGRWFRVRDNVRLEDFEIIEK